MDKITGRNAEKFHALTKVMSDDKSRIGMQRVKIDGNHAIATDGKCLVAIRHTFGLTPGSYQIIKSKKAETIVELDTETQFPNYIRVFPRHYEKSQNGLYGKNGRGDTLQISRTYATIVRNIPDNTYLDFSLLEKVYRCFEGENITVSTIASSNKAVLLRGNDRTIALIMPVETPKR